jgi:hypothetical protein
MAKKHKKHHRRRRVGALGGGKKSGMLIKIAGVAAGYFLGDSITNKLGTYMTTTTAATSTTAATTTPNTTAVMGVELGLGALLLLKKSSGTTGTVMKAAGGFLAGAGLKLALKKAGFISGYQSVPVIGRHRMAGYQNVPVIGGTPAQLAGVPGQLQGFKVGQYGVQGSSVISGFGKGGSTGSGLMNAGSGYMQ